MRRGRGKPEGTTLSGFSDQAARNMETVPQQLEKSVAADHPRALIQMATGAGKTYTACHRLLEHSKFRRVLFLADRANLVRQTRHEFENFARPAPDGPSPNSTMCRGSGRLAWTGMLRSLFRRSSASIRC
jgi:type I site-specific restriction endonuclease